MSGDCRSGGSVESSADYALFMLIADRDRGNNTFVTITPADDIPLGTGTPTGRWCVRPTSCAHDDDDWGPGRHLVREERDDVALYRAKSSVEGRELRFHGGQAALRYSLMTPPTTRFRRTGASIAMTTLGS